MWTTQILPRIQGPRIQAEDRDCPPVPKLLSVEQEAQVIALRLGPPPTGYANWSLRLLARRVVELEIVESVSHETIRRTLKNGMTRRKIEYWVIPPAADAEFVAHMEQVLDTYAQPYDPACPVVCMDEQPVQLVKKTRHACTGAASATWRRCTAKVSAWSIDANGTQRGVDWQMKVDDARRKLKSVYPTILT